GDNQSGCHRHRERDERSGLPARGCHSGRNPGGGIARILPRLWGGCHTQVLRERSLHAPRLVRGSSSIAEQVASYHQVPVQIRPPALSLSSGASLTPSRAPTTMYGGHLFQGDPVLTVALWQLATGSALAPAPARAAA